MRGASSSTAFICKAIPWEPKLPAREEAENLTREQLELLVRLNAGASRYVEEKLNVFIKTAIKEAKSDAPRSHVLILRAPWGYGKTYYGKIVIPKLAEQHGLSHVYVSFEDIVEEIYEKLSRASREGKPLNPESLIREKITSLFNRAAEDAKGRPVILFIDEVEAFLEGLRLGGKSIRGRIALSLMDELLSALKHLMKVDAPAPYRAASGRVHIILAVTPEAEVAIRRLARDRGIEGRLARRIETLSLLPLSKLDAIRLVKTILYDYFQLPHNAIDPRIINALYIVSGGNPGILLRLVNSLVYESYTYCREINGRECFCILDDPVIVARIMSRIDVSYTPGSDVSTKLLDARVVKILEQLMESNPEAVEPVARMLVYLEPLDYDKYTEIYNVIEGVFAHLGIKHYYVEIIQGSPNEILQLAWQTANELIGKIEIDADTIRIALENQIIISDNAYLFVLPQNIIVDIAEIELALLAMGIHITSDKSRILVDTLGKQADYSALKRVAGIMIVPSSIRRVFPPALARMIPFIRNPEDAIKLYEKVSRIKREDHEQYARLVIEGTRRALISEGILLERNGSLLARIPGIYSTTYLVPAKLEYAGIFVQTSFTQHRSRRARPLLTIRVISPPGFVSRSHNELVLDIELPIHEAELLAVAAFALENEDYKDLIDEGTLASFFEDIVQSRLADEDLERVRRVLVENGIAVPHMLPGEDKFKSYEGILNAYKILLLGGTSFNLDMLVEQLYTLYRIRPYKLGRALKWCNITVPKVLAIDLEPDDHRAFYLEGKYKEYLRYLSEKIETFISVAERIGLLKRVDVGYKQYRAIPHPVERRILELLNNAPRRKLLLSDLEEYFVYPEDANMASKARLLLKDFFLELLNVRGLIRFRQDTIERTSPLEETEKLRRRLRELINKINEIRYSGLGTVLASCGAEYNIDTVLTITLFKERGVKVIHPSYIVEALEKLSSDKLPARLMDDLALLVEGYLGLFVKAREDIINLVRKIRDAVKDVERVYFDAIRLLSKNLEISIDAEKTPRDIPDNKKLCSIILKALQETEKRLEIIKTNSMRSLDRKFKDMKNELRYDNCNNRYHFNAFLYTLYPRFEELEKKLSEKKTKLESSIQKLQELVKELRNSKCEPRMLTRELTIREKKIERTDDLQRLIDMIYNELKELSSACRQCYEEKETARIEVNSAFEKKDALIQYLENAKERRHLLEALLIEIEKLEKHNYALSDITEKILETINTANNSIGEYEANVKEAEDALNKLKERLENLTCRNLSLIKEVTASARRHTDTLNAWVSKLQSLLTQLDDSIEAVKKKLYAIHDVLRRDYEKFSELARRASTHDMQVAFQLDQHIAKLRTILDDIREKLEKTTDVKGIANKILEAETLRQKISKMLRKVIVRDVGEDAYKVLEALYSGGYMRARVRLSKLVSKLSQETKLPKEKVLRALLILDEKDYAYTEIVA